MKLIKRALALLMCLSCLGGGMALAEKDDEYEQMLSNAVLSLGNNTRLHSVLATASPKARARPNTTSATPSAWAFASRRSMAQTAYGA